MSGEVYCPECEAHRTSPYCPQCGTETKERTTETIDWPLTIEQSVRSPVEMDISHDLRRQLAASEILPDDVPTIPRVELCERFRFTVSEDAEYVDIERIHEYRCKNDDHGGIMGKTMVENDDGEFECPECGAVIEVKH